MVEQHDAKTVEEFYDGFAVQQIKKGINHRHLAIQRWLEKFGLKRSSIVLEIGAGIGTQTELLLLYLNSKGSVIANDISNDSLDVAKKRLSKYKNVSFLYGDIVKQNLEQQFDLILLPDVLEHIPSESHPDLFLRFADLLKPNGFILIHIPNPKYLDWVRNVNPSELQIIDQSISISNIETLANNSGLYIKYFESYSIYQIPEDYNVILLKKIIKTNYESNFQIPNDSIIRKIKRYIIKIVKI